MRRTEIATLTLPPGKSDHLVPYGTVPGLAVRLRAGRFMRVGFPVSDRPSPAAYYGRLGDRSVQEARRRATQLYARAKLGDDPARRQRRSQATGR
jgi:hypothetical protein